MRFVVDHLLPHLVVADQAVVICRIARDHRLEQCEEGIGHLGLWVEGIEEDLSVVCEMPLWRLEAVRDRRCDASPIDPVDMEQHPSAVAPWLVAVELSEQVGAWRQHVVRWDDERAGLARGNIGKHKVEWLHVVWYYSCEGESGCWGLAYVAYAARSRC